MANRVNKSVSVWVTLAGVVLLLFPYFFNYFVGGLIRQFNIDSFEVSRMRRAANLKHYIGVFISSFLAAGALYIMLRYHSLQGQAFLWLLGTVICQILLLAKPISYSTLTYQWLIKSFNVAPLAFFLATTLQGFSPAPALIYLASALFLGMAAAMITLSYKRYAGDLNRKERTFLVVIGWEKAITLHHLLFAGSVASLVIYMLVSNSVNTNWPVLAWQVFGLYEVYLLEQLARGVKPNYVLLDALAVFRMLGTLYLLFYALIIH